MRTQTGFAGVLTTLVSLLVATSALGAERPKVKPTTDPCTKTCVYFVFLETETVWTWYGERCVGDWCNVDLPAHNPENPTPFCDGGCPSDCLDLITRKMRKDGKPHHNTHPDVRKNGLSKKQTHDFKPKAIENNRGAGKILGSFFADVNLSGKNNPKSIKVKVFFVEAQPRGEVQQKDCPPKVYTLAVEIEGFPPGLPSDQITNVDSSRVSFVDGSQKTKWFLIRMDESGGEWRVLTNTEVSTW